MPFVSVREGLNGFGAILGRTWFAACSMFAASTLAQPALSATSVRLPFLPRTDITTDVVSTFGVAETCWEQPGRSQQHGMLLYQISAIGTHLSKWLLKAAVVWLK